MSTFNEVHYTSLLKGLEVSIIKKSELNGELRYEAEFFRKRYLAEESALSKWKTIQVGEFADVTDGPHGYHIVDESSPVVMLTAKNAKNWFTDREDAEHIAKSVDDANKRSSLAASDIILSTRGTLGFCALVTTEALPANIDQDVARISWRKHESVKPEYVVAYLNSRYGQDHITRQASGMVQQGLPLQKVRRIPVPLLPERVQRSVANTVQAALVRRRNSRAKLVLAEQTLLRTLGLEKWQPPEPLTYTHRSAEVFEAERMDPDYFSPTKLAALHALAAVPHKRLDSHYRAVRDMFAVGKEGRVRNFDVTDALQPVLDDEKEPISAQEIGSTKKIFKAGDVVISRLRSYLREIAVVRTTPGITAVGSSEFVVLRQRPDNTKRLSSETLMVFLRSEPVQTILRFCQDGSNHPRFAEKELLSIPVPDPVLDLVPTIDRLVNESLALRHEAQMLLTQAKSAVENAIEQNEDAALQNLDDIQGS